MKKTMLTIVLCVAILLFIGIVNAETLADSVFSAARVTLKDSKSTTFTASTYATAASIKVTRVELYEMIGTSWVYVQDLPVPSDEATNTCLFTATKSYSASIGTGTYRLKATFTADGHSMARYSNSKTY